MTTEAEIDAIQTFYTNNLVRRLERSPTFLGNCEFPTNFVITTRSNNHLDNQTFSDPNTKLERKFLVFGEVASAERGTKLGAQGNHFSTSTTERTPVQDGSRAKDILKLREPVHATKDIEILFANQAVPLTEVVIENIEKDKKINKSAFLTSECTEVDDDDYSRVYTVQLPKKFGSPPESYVPDAPQRLKKRKLGSQPEEKRDRKEEKRRVNEPKQSGEVKIGGYYSPELLPDYSPSAFHLKHDQLVQHNIVDAKDELIPCWNNLFQLREGTLVICVVTLHTWNIPGTGREGYKNFKRYYTLNAHSVRVLRESWIPEPTRYKASPPPTDFVEIAPSAEDEFDSFTDKKSTDTWTIISTEQPFASTSKVDVETPVASSSKTAEKKGQKKPQKKAQVETEKVMGVDTEMDTSV